MSPLKSDLSYWLNKYNIKPNKDLGQCFLIAENALNKIVSTAEIKSGDKVLEIGGGTGVLTEKLLKKGAEVLVIEKDSRLALVLHERFDKERKIGKLKIIQSDFLDLPFPETLERIGWKSGNYKAVANLPYQITSPAIERILEREFLPSLAVFTVQKEVAERICAPAGDLSSLAVLVQACARNCTLTAKFPAGYFYPAPEVDSALIKLGGISYDKLALTTSNIDPSTPPPKAELLPPSPRLRRASRMTSGKVGIKDLRRVIRAGFSQKRKKLKKNLQNIFEKEIVEEIWKKLDLPENVRAQELEVEKWIEIAKNIQTPKSNFK